MTTDGMKSIPLHYVKDICNETGAKNVVIITTGDDGSFDIVAWIHPKCAITQISSEILNKQYNAAAKALSLMNATSEHEGEEL